MSELSYKERLFRLKKELEEINNIWTTSIKPEINDTYVFMSMDKLLEECQDLLKDIKE